MADTPTYLLDVEPKRDNIDYDIDYDVLIEDLTSRLQPQLGRSELVQKPVQCRSTSTSP